MITLSLAPGAGFDVRTLDDLDTYLGAVAGAGFAGVSLGLQQLAGDPAGAARLVDDHGLRCTDVIALTVTRDDEASLAQAEQLARAVDALGAPFVLALIFTRVGGESIDRFARCADVVVKAGARLALEMPPAGDLNHIGAALDVVRAVGTDRAALMVDTFHFSRGRSTWDELASLPLDELAYVQFDDALPPISDDVMHETMHRRAMPGDGELELERFASALLDRGWSGTVSVEVLSEELRKLDIATFARRAHDTTAPYWE